MPTILELFKSKQKDTKPTEIYGLKGTVIIESRGLLNPSRTAALALSSPNPVADLIGAQGNGYFGGSARRPDDTIFKNTGPLTKPITLLAVTPSLLQDAVKPDTPYYVKPIPMPNKIPVKKTIEAFKNPDAGISFGIAAIREFGGKSGFKKFKKMFSTKGNKNGYGPPWQSSNADVRKRDLALDANIVKKYSTHHTLFEPKVNKRTGKKEFSRKSPNTAEVRERKNTKVVKGQSPHDLVNDQLLKSTAFDSDKWENAGDSYTLATRIQNSGHVFVYIKIYGKNKGIVLPGAISGISEDLAPEISSFRYVGSPFNLYKYLGVERTIKFNLKVYALDAAHEMGLRNKIDELRKLVYPDEDIATATYAATNTYSPLYFTPNLIELTVYGLYSGVVGIVDTLSITIPDEASWASWDFGDATDEDKSLPHPTVFDVSFGMKVINNPSITQKDGKSFYNYGSSAEEKNKYSNYFTGYGHTVNSAQTKNELDQYFITEKAKKDYLKEVSKKLEWVKKF